MHARLFACALSAALAVAPWSAAFAQACSRHSPAHTVALLELYTSEGCSSCPPADRFISGLRDSGLTEQQVVPLALHVDYWDYIGWKDRFSQPLFSVRQRELAALASSRVIYTPEIFVAGRELRDWRGGLDAVVRRINARPAQATIGIQLGAPSASSLPVVVQAQAPQGSRLFVALYENRLSSSVKAGENSGALLKHDYVVRDWRGPIAAAGAGLALRQALPLPADAVRKNLGIAAFVEGPDGAVLQALALRVCTG